MDNKLFKMDPEHFAPGNDKLKEFAKQFREKIEKIKEQKRKEREEAAQKLLLVVEKMKSNKKVS